VDALGVVSPDLQQVVGSADQFPFERRAGLASQVAFHRVNAQSRERDRCSAQCVSAVGPDDGRA
jgi:hypothetical protein